MRAVLLIALALMLAAPTCHPAQMVFAYVTWTEAREVWEFAPSAPAPRLLADDVRVGDCVTSTATRWGFLRVCDAGADLCLPLREATDTEEAALRCDPERTF